MKSRGRAGHNRNLGFLTWLYPGMHVERWLLLMIFGVALFGLGVGYFLRELYITYTFPQLVYYLTLQFIPRIGRGILFIVLSTGAIGIGVWGFNRSLLSAFLTGSADRLVDIVYQHRYGRRGPKVVAIGGGTGLSVLLRGLKEQTDNLTAIVTVADDGGSSGRLRKEMGVLPPGDFRNCIAALADAEPLMTRLLQYRFSEGSGLDGHSFGNLFIVAMSGVVGNFEEAIRETSRVLAVRGQILPSTPENVILTAEIDGQETVRGESNIPGIGLPISRVSLEPADVPAHVDAVDPHVRQIVHHPKPHQITPCFTRVGRCCEIMPVPHHPVVARKRFLNDVRHLNRHSPGEGLVEPSLAAPNVLRVRRNLPLSVQQNCWSSRPGACLRHPGGSLTRVDRLRGSVLAPGQPG